jgi:hypothetical protein
MSDNKLKLISTVPEYIPDEVWLSKAIKLINMFSLSPGKITVENSEDIRFIDQGTNLVRINCPLCNKEIFINWWQDQMDIAYQDKFRNIFIETPCCGMTISLNELNYYWPAGFAKFSIEILNPSNDINDLNLKLLESELKTELRKIWAHY